MKVKAIPSGYSSVTPYLIVDGATEAIEFYKKVFGARLAAISDGIFAVAMTLLVLDLRNPAHELIHSEQDFLLANGDHCPGSRSSPNADG